MAKLLMCAVKDKCVGAFMNPFTARSQAEAMRGFSDAVNDPKMEFGRHPEHYALYVVGEWDDHAGKAVELDENVKLIEAKDCIATVS